MKTRMFDGFGKTVAVGSISVGVLAGCTQEAPNYTASEVYDTTSTSVGEEPHSILDRTPEGMSELSWCGYEAARVAITDILTSENTIDLGDGFFKNDQGSASAQETSIGYVYHVDAIVDAETRLAVRGEWSVQSSETTPLATLDPAVFDQSTLRINPDSPIAVWNLDDDTGGTTNDMEVAGLCAVAQDVVDNLEK